MTGTANAHAPLRLGMDWGWGRGELPFWHSRGEKAPGMGAVGAWERLG